MDSAIAQEIMERNEAFLKITVSRCIVVDIVVVEGAVGVHVRGVVLIVAGGTQPPPPIQYRTRMNTLFGC